MYLESKLLVMCVISHIFPPGPKETSIPTDQISSEVLINEKSNVPFSSKELALSRVRFSPVTASRLGTISSLAEDTNDALGQTAQESCMHADMSAQVNILQSCILYQFLFLALV